MKQDTRDRFRGYTESLSEEDSDLLRTFFAEFDAHCLIADAEKRKLRSDFERAIIYFSDAGLPLRRALERLDPANLGGFYARPPVLWFPLDDAAKVYPLSMEQGRMSVFRLSVYLRRDVVPELLQMALNFTIKRFPSFATTLKKGFFWHYLDTTKRRFCVERESSVPCEPLRVARSGSQSFRVVYFANRISVEFFHVLTDGTGGMIFLKSLAAEYLRLTGVSIPAGETVWDPNTEPDAEEFENAFARVPLSQGASGFVERAAVQMSGELCKTKPCRIIHLKMSASALKSAASKYHSTVTSFLLALMFIAGRTATDELHGEASIQVPVNMRKFYPSRTVRNFSMYCGIRLPLDTKTDVASLASDIDRQLRQKASREAMSEMLTATERLVAALKYFPLALKQPAARLVYGFLGDRIFSNTLSNLGVVPLPAEMAEHIESMDFVLGTAITNRACCALVTVGDTATFSITKMTADPTFEEKMHRLLSENGVPVTAEGSELYET